MVSGCDKGITRRTLFQTRQHVEDTTAPIVEQKDAQVTTQVLVPQGVLIVEETQVADDTADTVVGYHREACCRRERALDTIHTTITPHGMFGETVGQTNGGAVGIVHLCLTHITLEILHSSHLGIGGLIGISLLTDA